MLYDVSIKTYTQILGAVTKFLEKGREHCTSNGIDLDAVVETSLYPDMLPFRFQIVSVAHHSLGAIEGVEAGVFGPPSMSADLDYEALQAMAGDAHEKIQAYTPDVVNALEGSAVEFKIGGQSMPFIAEDFLMSFSLPNFYFHATTAYDILRMQGVPLGKRDFLGQMRLNM